MRRMSKRQERRLRRHLRNEVRRGNRRIAASLERGERMSLAAGKPPSEKVRRLIEGLRSGEIDITLTHARRMAEYHEEKRSVGAAESGGSSAARGE